MDKTMRKTFSLGKIIHASDCAVHNEPAYQNGECNCGVYQARSESTSDTMGHRSFYEAQQRIAELEALLQQAIPYIKYPRNSPDAYVIAHNNMIERIEAALGKEG